MTFFPTRDYSALIDRVRAGDSAALAQLTVDLAAVIRYASRRWRGRLPAKDLEHTVRYAIWRAARTFDPSKGRGFQEHAKQRIRAELRRAVCPSQRQEREESYDAYQVEGDMSGVDLLVHDDASPDVHIGDAMLTDAVRAAVAKLPQAYRDVILARLDDEDLPFAEIPGFNTRQYAQIFHKRALEKLARMPDIQRLKGA